MKEHTKRLKEELSQNFPDKFRFRNTPSEISIYWKDGTALDKVEKVAKKHEEIYIGELGFKYTIRYVNCNREISDKAKEAVKEKLIATVDFKDTSKDSYAFFSQLWKTINATDF